MFTRTPELPATDVPVAEANPATPADVPRRRRWMRRLGTALVVLGIVALAYGAAIYFWRDPVTDLYTRWKQHELQGALSQSFAEYRPALELPEGGPTASDGEATAPEGVSPAALQEAVEAAAGTMLSGIEEGDALGRLTIPALGIHPVVVNGTRWGPDLSRGPGRYPETSLPGLGEVTAIAGHRTTFGAWFREIDRLRAGDTITLELPYGTFQYRVVSHEIVDNDDWSIIRDRGFDALVLSACHPLYSASHRWIVYAQLAGVELPDGSSYAVAADGSATAA